MAGGPAKFFHAGFSLDRLCPTRTLIAKNAMNRGAASLQAAYVVAVLDRATCAFHKTGLCPKLLRHVSLFPDAIDVGIRVQNEYHIREILRVRMRG